jgi:hypothetical protein
VFEVGGVIDLGRSTLEVREPFVTIAGHTAPSPGITLIRGGMDVRTHDVIIEHIRIRPGDNGEPRASGFAEDSISTVAARNVVVDHCSLTWAVDENLSASGPRFTGATPCEWQAGTSANILFSNNLLAEGLADSTHPKFEHSKGSLIHDNIQNIWIYRNVYAHNFERNPLFKGGGTVFGPRPRSYSFKLNKGLKRLARKSALTIKAQESNLVVVENFEFEAPSTKKFINVLKALGLDNKKSLFVLGDTNNNVYLSSRNLKTSSVITSSELNTYAVLNAASLVLLEGSLAGIEETLSK